MEKLSRVKLDNNIGIAHMEANDGAVVPWMFDKVYNTTFYKFDWIYWRTILIPQLELFNKLNYEKLIQNG